MTFDDWLDQQIVQSLLSTRPYEGNHETSLHQIAKALIETSLTHEEASHLFEVTNGVVGAVAPKVFRAAGELSALRAIRHLMTDMSFEAYLSKFAAKMASNLGLTAQNGSREFCAALLLLQTEFRTEAADWLLTKAIPPELPAWPRQGAPEFAVRHLLPRCLAKIQGGLILCFDQLEALYANSGSSNQAPALANLISRSINLVRKEPHVACIVSTVPGTETSMASLDSSERDRLIEPPGPQDLDFVDKTNCEIFLEPRFRYLAECEPDADLSYLASFSKNFWELAGIPSTSSRIILRAINEFAREAAKCQSEPIESIARRVAEKYSHTEPYDQTQPSTAPTKDEQVNSLENVENNWQHVLARAAPTIKSDNSTIAQLLRWGIENVASSFVTINRVTETAIRYDADTAIIDFTVFYPNAKHREASIYIVNEPNSGSKLADQLKRVSKHQNDRAKVLVRTRSRIPTGQASAVGKIRRTLEEKGARLVEVQVPEMIALRQLMTLAEIVDHKAFSQWVSSREGHLPGLRQCVSQHLV